jgi:transposase
MARHMKPWRRTMVVHMISSGKFTIREIAQAAKCSDVSVSNICKKLRLFGCAKPDLVRAGRPPNITLLMITDLCNHLAKNPTLYVEEMAIYLQNEFDISLPSSSSVKRVLSQAGWTNKKVRYKAKEQNPQLRAFYQHKLSKYFSYQLVFVDETGCDKRVGNRQSGWSPLGVAPVRVSKFHRGQRYHILPAYAQDGIIASDIFQGSTDAVIFENFIERLLQHCGRYPAPKSVLIMDNASFHRSDRVKQLCSDAGVKLLYLPPYSPDFNPIEEFFAELKGHIKKAWPAFEEYPEQGFRSFLRKCIHAVGERKESAEGHFRHSGITVEYIHSP